MKINLAYDECPAVRIAPDENGRPHIFLDGEEVPPPHGFSMSARYTRDPVFTLDYGDGESVSVRAREIRMDYKGVQRVDEERGKTRYSNDNPILNAIRGMSDAQKVECVRDAIQNLHEIGIEPGSEVDADFKRLGGVIDRMEKAAPESSAEERS